MLAKRADRRVLVWAWGQILCHNRSAQVVMGVVRRVASGMTGCGVIGIVVIPATGKSTLIAVKVISSVTGTVCVGFADGLD